MQQPVPFHAGSPGHKNNTLQKWLYKAFAHVQILARENDSICVSHCQAYIMSGQSCEKWWYVQDCFPPYPHPDIFHKTHISNVIEYGAYRSTPVLCVQDVPSALKKKKDPFTIVGEADARPSVKLLLLSLGLFDSSRVDSVDFKASECQQQKYHHNDDLWLLWRQSCWATHFRNRWCTQPSII